MCTKNHNHMRYTVPEIDIHFCHFGPFSVLYPSPSNNVKNQNFENMKKASGDVIISDMWTKNHMMYAS